VALKPRDRIENFDLARNGIATDSSQIFVSLPAYSSRNTLSTFSELGPMPTMSFDT
jgi:hypothetical protein